VRFRLAPDIYHILLTTSKASQDVLQNVVPNFISAEKCPTHSADMNPLDIQFGTSCKNLCMNMKGVVNRQTCMN